MSNNWVQSGRDLRLCGLIYRVSIAVVASKADANFDEGWWGVELYAPSTEDKKFYPALLSLFVLQKLGVVVYISR